MIKSQLVGVLGNDFQFLITVFSDTFSLPSPLNWCLTWAHGKFGIHCRRWRMGTKPRKKHKSNKENCCCGVRKSENLQKNLVFSDFPFLLPPLGARMLFKIYFCSCFYFLLYAVCCWLSTSCIYWMSKQIQKQKREWKKGFFLLFQFFFLFMLAWERNDSSSLVFGWFLAIRNLLVCVVSTLIVIEIV